MKKLLLSLSALLILGLPNVMGQAIPNLGFETWSPDALAAGTNDPNTGNNSSGWWDFNFDGNALLGSSPATVFKGTANPAPEQGSAYAEIVSNAMTSSTYSTLQGYGFPYPDTNGLMQTAFVNAGFSGVTYKPGVPFGGGRISSFSFWYRYIPVAAGDTASCVIGMYHYSSHTRNLIGGGAWSSSGTQGAWKQVTVPIFYDSATSMPDTAFISFSACGGRTCAHKPKPGDTLDIDESAVTGIANVSEQHDNVNLYPNPANTEINLAVSGQFNAATLAVYDITGRAMGTYPIRNNFLTINTQSFNSGMYIYKLLDNSGNQLNVGKFSVVK